MAALPAADRLRALRLSVGEARVVVLAVRGYLVREIASELSLAEGTVKQQIARARQKQGCRTIRELVSLVLQSGLLLDDEVKLRPAE